MTTTSYDRAEKGWRTVYLIYGLYALGIVTSGLASVVGVILAHLKSGTGATYEINAHYKNQIEIFWTVFVVGLIGLVLTMVGIGIIILFGLSIWTIYAVAKGTLAAINQEPI